MADMEKVIKTLEEKISISEAVGEAPMLVSIDVLRSILELLKEQDARELTIDEWREWKNNPKRNPICKLWEHDTSPMWVLNPNNVHEPALLMGKLKLFTGKPTFEQCMEAKWNDNQRRSNPVA